VQLSWNGNGGQFLGILNTDKNGAATNCASSTNCIVAPPAPAGTYTLTAIGSTSRSQASTSVVVNISTVVTPQNVGPGSAVQVIGSGFLAGENLTIYFQDPANGTVSTQADGTGSFTQSLTLPKMYSSQASYTVFVKNAQNAVLAGVPFSFEALSITPSVTKATPGTSITISGKGFLANESVSLSWNIRSFWQMRIGKVNTDATGNFTKTITAPDIFDTMNFTLAAIGNSSNLQAKTSITVGRASTFGTPGTQDSGSFSGFREH
jgi:hypothetical protein